MQSAPPFIVGHKALPMLNLNSFTNDSNEYFFFLKKSLLGTN